MRRLFFSLFALAILASFASAQAKRPFTFEDMMKLKRVGEPEVSPDGKWVIFSVVDVDLAANTKTPHVWIVPLSRTAGSSTPVGMTESGGGTRTGAAGMTDSREREIIGDQDADRPRWAPDGKRFAFISTKEGGSQVWSADFDSKTGTVTWVHKVTSIPTEVGGELWSPDGKTLLFTSDVYPECDGDPVAEEECNAKKVEEAANSKVKALIFDHLLYRHWNSYKEGKRTHIFALNANFQIHIVVGKPEEIITARPIDLTPGDYDAPVFSLGGQDDYAFSPDGQEICYASNHDKNPAASTNNDLWIVPVSGGAAKNITADNPASDSTPLYSPDSRYIAYRAQQRPGYESDRFRLMLYDRKTGDKKNLTEGFDRWVGTYIWAPDSSRVYFSAEASGTQPIFSVDIAPHKSSASEYEPCDFCSGSVHELLRDSGYNDDLAAGPDNSLLFTKMTATAPHSIWFLSRGCTLEASTTKHKIHDEQCSDLPSTPRMLTSFNRDVFSQLELNPLESFWFTGAHNDKVQGFLVKPPNFDAAKKYPVKFLIHGGPQGAWGDDWSYRWNPELLAANGYVVIMINFHGSTGYGQKFIDAINGDWGGAPYEDLMKGLDYAEKTYPFIDKDRECALGARRWIHEQLDPGAHRPLQVH